MARVKRTLTKWPISGITGVPLWKNRILGRDRVRYKAKEYYDHV